MLIRWGSVEYSGYLTTDEEGGWGGLLDDFWQRCPVIQSVTSIARIQRIFYFFFVAHKGWGSWSNFIIDASPSSNDATHNEDWLHTLKEVENA